MTFYDSKFLLKFCQKAEIQILTFADFFTPKKFQPLKIDFPPSLVKILCTYLKLYSKIYIIIASYYRQLSADIKMKKYKINNFFISHAGAKAQVNKTGINFILIFVENFCNTMLYIIFQSG